MWICLTDYRYLPESEALTLPCPNGSGQLLTVRMTGMLNLSPYHEWQKENCQSLQYGTMLQRFPGSNLIKELISSTAVFRVKTSVLQDLVKAWKESEADLFLKSLDSQTNLNPPLFSSKMCRQFAQEDLTEFYKNLPKDGMIVDGRCYRLPKSELITKGKGGFYWPTITASEGGQGNPKERGLKLNYAVKMFPSPVASDATCGAVIGNENREFAEVQQEWRKRKYRTSKICEDVTDTASKGLQGQPQIELERKQQRCVKTGDGDIFSKQWWLSEPDVGRVANGVQNRVDRIKCMGNAVVPLQAKTAFERLMGITE
jgi:hypothetical protein